MKLKVYSTKDEFKFIESLDLTKATEKEFTDFLCKYAYGVPFRAVFLVDSTVDVQISYYLSKILDDEIENKTLAFAKTHTGKELLTYLKDNFD